MAHQYPNKRKSYCLSIFNENKPILYEGKKQYFRTKKKVWNREVYDSNFEAEYAMVLDDQQKKGEIKSWEKQKTLDLVVNGYKICTYKIDFIVYHNDGTTEYVETKGFATPVWKLKWKIFEATWSEKPDVKLTVVYQGKTWKPRLTKVK